MKKIFDEEWHPLYGSLPPYIVAPKSQAARCISIMQDARKIWLEDWRNWTSAINDIIAAHEVERGKYANLEAGPQLKEKWHDAKDVADKLAWAIFCECIHIYQHSVLGDGPHCYYRKESGKVDTKHSLDTVWEKAVSFIRTYLGRWGFCYEGLELIPDYAFLAIIALHEAHYVLQSIYEYKESDEDVILIEDVQIASAVLLQAERLRAGASVVPLASSLVEIMTQRMPSLFSHNRDKEAESPTEVVTANAFNHNPDYTRVSINGEEYDLPFDKGKLIKVLHEAYKAGQPVLSKKYAMEKAGLKGRFTDLFKTAKTAREALIVEENNGRSCRLNI